MQHAPRRSKNRHPQDADVFSGDASFLERFRAGHLDVLDGVYRAHVASIRRLVAGILRRYAASAPGGWRAVVIDLPDLVQEVFVRAFSAPTRRGFDGVRAYGPYLGRIARNTVVDYLRRRRRQGAADLWAARTCESPPAHEGSVTELAVGIADHYVESLPAYLRCVHRLLYDEGRSQRDAAAALGVGRQAIRTLDRRLRQGLRFELARAGLDGLRS
jgi:RNA polymerase sigma-70 factor (ECF subfamily)